MAKARDAASGSDEVLADVDEVTFDNVGRRVVILEIGAKPRTGPVQRADLRGSPHSMASINDLAEALEAMYGRMPGLV